MISSDGTVSVILVKPPRSENQKTVLMRSVTPQRFLENLGFEVKGEVCGCDLVALRADEPPVVVIGELKLTFNLDLVLQGWIGRPPVMKSGWPYACRGGAAANTIRE
jgi:hypothetical protein